MKSVFKYFLTIFFIGLIDGNQFRCDYNIYLEKHGWFKMHRIPATWQNARLQCRLEGASLASPLPEFKGTLKYIIERTNVSNHGIFTGIHATYSKGNFYSLQGVPLSEIPHVWDNGEPDNYDNKEDCIAMLPSGSLADVKCEDTYPYICFKEDSDTFVNSCGTIDPEYNLDTRTGSCYKFHRNVRTWAHAHATCSAEGGYLAIINSEEEAKVIKDLYQKNPENTIKGNFWHDVAFIGFQYWNETGEWITLDGKTITAAGYDKFKSGEPNNADPGEYCGGVYREGLLDDLWCYYNHPFICEKKPSSLRCTDDFQRINIPN